EGLACFLYAPSGKTYGMMADVTRALRERGAELLVVSNQQELLNQAQTPFHLPPVPEPLSPLVAVVVGQLFAYHLARVKGRDPDVPHGDLQVILSVSEEVGLAGAHALAPEVIAGGIGFVFDAGGPTGTIITAAPTHSVLDIRFAGRAAHAGFAPEKGINAIRA